MTILPPIETRNGWVTPVNCDGPECTGECVLPVDRSWISVAVPTRPFVAALPLHFCSYRCLGDWAYDPERGADRGSGPPRT